MTLKVAVHGAAGRMGRSVIAEVIADAGAVLAAAVDRSDCPAIGRDAGALVGHPGAVDVALTADLEPAIRAAEVVIDFALPGAVPFLATACADDSTPLVIGTTGLDDAALSAIEALAKKAPVVVAPNFSVGVNALWYLSARAVELLGPDFDLEIVEMHHRHKVDAPSGTAVRLAEAVSRARGLDAKMAPVHGRSGQVGVRKTDEIGVLALRGGDVVGEHTLVMAGPGERLEITHRAHDRSIFARGSLRAAHWVVGRKPGRYDMADVLGFDW
jgi:4-hydroxy-tetrahydrodipicolinate reductase